MAEISSIPFATDTFLWGIASTGVGATAMGQSFSAGVSGKLTSVHFKLKKSGAPTGTMTVKIYAHSGTFGISSVCGALLATSTGIAVSSLTTTSTDTTFSFTGVEKIDLVSGTNYVVIVDGVTGDAGNYVATGYFTASGYAGNLVYYNAGWLPSGTGDMGNIVNGDVASVVTNPSSPFYNLS